MTTSTIIDDIKVRKVYTEGKVKALVSITIAGIAIHEIRVIKGESRIFTAFPSRKDIDGVYHDIIHPISAEVRDAIEAQILDAYERYCESAID